jgi:hypothetical protein
MFLDPNKLTDSAPADILTAAARGQLGLDHRFLHALLDRKSEAIPAVVEFAKQDHGEDLVDLDGDLINLFRYWKTEEGLPFLIGFIRQVPEDLPDEIIETLAEIGQPALEPLLSLYGELEEDESGEVAFILASLRIRDPRILTILTDRLDYDLSDSIFLLSLYGDREARPAIEKAAAALSEKDKVLLAEVENALRAIDEDASIPDEDEPFDIWALYPEEADLPIELLDEDERTELLGYPIASVRAAAAGSFFNRELSPEVRKTLLALARNDESVEVRTRAWEALTDATEDTEVIEAMLDALRNPDLSVRERGGLMVGLAPEADRNEVRKAIADLYQAPEGRAKALEAMWRSVHPSFRDYFAKHLNDSDPEIRRGAVWGVGYYGLKGELEHIRKLFEDEDLRSDALFAYSLAVPGDVSRGRMKGLFSRIEKDAHGLSEFEEELVKAALDERLLLSGKEPYFSAQRD